MGDISDRWPRLRPPLKRRIRLKISELLLNIGSNLAERDSNWFRRLQDIAEREPIVEEVKPSPPDDAQLNLERVLYGDIYHVENFNSLKNGVDSLFESYQHRPFSTFRPEKWHEWVEKRRQQPDVLGSYNVGFLGLSEVDLPFERCYVTALGFEAHVILGLNFTPSKDVKREFRETVSEGGDPTILFQLNNLFKPLSEIPLFNSIRYSLGYSVESASSDLARKIDRLLLQCNKEAVELLQSHIGAGLGENKPLPSLEVISTALPRSKILSFNERHQKQESGNLENSSLDRDLWESIGQSRPPNPWRWTWAQLYRSQRSDEYQFRSYQLLVHKPDLVRSGEFRIGDREPRQGESAFGLELSAYLRFRTARLGATLAIEEQLQRHRERLIALRNLLIPQLKNRGLLSLPPYRVLLRGMDYLAEMNAIRFSRDHLVSQLEDERTRIWITDSLQGAKRSSRDSDSPVDFITDWWDRVESLESNVRSRLERTESTYEQLFSIMNAQGTFFLQFAVFVLTLVLLWLTAEQYGADPIDIFVRSIKKSGFWN